MKLFHILLVALTGLSLTSANPTERKDDGDVQNGNRDALVKEWHDLNKLISKSKPALEPEETLKHFRRLHEIAAEVAPLIKRDRLIFKYDAEFSEIIVRLADSDKCTLDELIFMSNKLSNEAHESIEKLLEQLIAKRFAVCKPKYDQELKDILQSIPQQRDNVAQLGKEVVKYDRGYGEADDTMPTFTFNGLTRGSFDFLKQQNPQFSKKTPKEEFVRLFESSILDSCKTIEEQIKGPTRFYKLVSNAHIPEASRSIKQESYDWLIWNHVCAYLAESKQYHIDIAYEILRGYHKSNKFLLDPREIQELKEEKARQKEIESRAEWAKRGFTCKTFFCLV